MANVLEFKKKVINLADMPHDHTLQDGSEMVPNIQPPSPLEAALDGIRGEIGPEGLKDMFDDSDDDEDEGPDLDIP